MHYDPLMEPNLHSTEGRHRHSMRRPLAGPFVWDHDELARDDSWQIRWSQTELDDIDRSLRFAIEKGVRWQNVRKQDFPLGPTLRTLVRAANELEDGRGIVKLSGMPVDTYSDEEIRLIWMGLGKHLGTPVYQDCHGQLMREIRDEAGSLGERHGRIIDPADGSEFLSSKARTYGNGPLRFHTDRTDVVGLLTMRQAKSGGVSKVASVGAVHNGILRRRPDLLDLLYQPVYRSRLGEEEGGESMIYGLPVFGLRDGKLTSHYSRTYIEAAQLLPTTPRMTDSQWAALDLLAETAERLCFQMVLEPGDIQLLNNHVVYHARTAFSDHSDANRKRLLYRLWLCMPNNRALPEDHSVLWQAVEARSLRGGILVD